MYISCKGGDNSSINIDEFFKFHGKDISTLNELIEYEVFFSSIDQTNNIVVLTSLGKLICLYHTYLYIKDIEIPKKLLDEDYNDFTHLITNIKWKKTEENVFILDLKKYDSVIYKLEMSTPRICLFEINGKQQDYVEVFTVEENVPLDDVFKQINAYLKNRHLMISEINKKISNMF